MLASATIAPRSIAASVGLRPTAPLIAAITQSAGRSRGFEQRALAGRRLDAAAGQRLLQFAVGRRIGDRGKARADFARELGQRRARCAAR